MDEDSIVSRWLGPFPGVIPGSITNRLVIDRGSSFSKKRSKHFGAVSSVEKMQKNSFGCRDEIGSLAVLNRVALESSKDEAFECSFQVG